MSLLDDLKAKMDSNSDGRVSKEDLDSIRQGNDDSMIDKLKAVTDQNDDGQLGMEDIKNFNLGDTMSDVKNLF